MKLTLWSEAQLAFLNTFRTIMNTSKKLFARYPGTTGAQSSSIARPVSAVLGIRRSAQADLKRGQMTCQEVTLYTGIPGASATAATWLALFAGT